VEGHVLGLLFIKCEDRMSQHLGIICLYDYYYMFRPNCRPSSGSLQNHINKGLPVLYKQFICCYKTKLVFQNGIITYNSVLK
jgi:hypothetical protein